MSLLDVVLEGLVYTFKVPILPVVMAIAVCIAVRYAISHKSMLYALPICYGIFASAFLVCLPVALNFTIAERYPHFYPCTVGLAVVSLVVCVVSSLKNRSMLLEVGCKKRVVTFEAVSSIVMFICSFGMLSPLVWFHDFGIG